MNCFRIVSFSHILLVVFLALSERNQLQDIDQMFIYETYV